MTGSFCRIGVFYDGSYFAYAQRHFYRDRKLGWLEFRRFHELLETFVRVKEQGYNSYRVVYAAWFQGLFPVTQSDEQRLRFDRNLYHDLMHAGIDPKYNPTSQAGKSEKGADVALAIDALQIGLERKIDIAALVSVCQKTPLLELSCHDPPHFPRQLQPNFVQEDASDRSGWGDWWWTGPDLRNAAIGRRSRLLGSGFKG